MVALIPPGTPRVDFWVPGVPQPQGSKRAFRNPHSGNINVVENSKKVAPWRTDVKEFARQAMADKPLFVGAVHISISFVLYRPTGLPKTRPTPEAVKKPDLDKLTRAVFDALKGTVYSDDSQVVNLVTDKRIAELGEPTGAQIEVIKVFEA
jgi:Holliday junction resolvase RusA-like endonuclease